MTTPDTQAAPVNACDLIAIAPDELEGSIALAKRLLFKEAQESHELPNGYAWRLSADQYSEVCQFIDYDRRCCAMYTHTLEVTPAHGPIWLRVTTDNGELKASLLAEIAALQAEVEHHLSPK
jgi:methylaspartate ammonia-lyase